MADDFGYDWNWNTAGGFDYPTGAGPSGTFGNPPNALLAELLTQPATRDFNAEAVREAQLRQAAARDAELRSKGVKGTSHWEQLSPRQQGYVEGRTPGELEGKNIEEEYRSKYLGFVNNLLNNSRANIGRGNTPEVQKNLDAAVDFAASKGSLNAPNPLNHFWDQVAEDVARDMTNRRGPPSTSGEYKTLPEQYPTSMQDILFNRPGARDTKNFNARTLEHAAIPTIIGAPLQSVPTIGNTILQALTGKSPYASTSRFGVNYNVNIDRDTGELFADIAPGEAPSIDYGNDYIENVAPIQTLDPNINPGAFNREAALEELIGRTQSNTTNPGIADSYFNNIIRQGIINRNQELGENIDENQFNNAFSSDFLGQGLLDDETTNLQGQATDRLNQVFTGNAFDPLDDSIINSIVQERAEPARKQISTAVARGNYNPTGGRTANQAIDFQTPAATSRVKEIGEGVLGGYGKDISALKDTAQTGISGFKLGDDLFDVSPFAEQRSNLIEDKSQSLQGDISNAIGNEPLFNSGEALAKGGRVQGVVSGQPSNQTFLDTIAAREAQGARNSRSRGLGSRGSGVF